MIARSKRYKNSVKDLSSDEELSLNDALRLAGFGKANFDETVELSFSLGVDPKQSSLAVRGTVNLPNGSGRKFAFLSLRKNQMKLCPQVLTSLVWMI